MTDHPPDALRPPDELHGTVEDSFELDKRQYLPGVTVKSACPECHRVYTVDLGDSYLSHPSVGEPEDVYFYCEEAEGDPDHFVEWYVQVVVRVTVELAP